MKKVASYISKKGDMTIVGKGLPPDYYKDEQLVKALCVVLVMETTYGAKFKPAMIEYLKTYWSYKKFMTTMSWLYGPANSEYANEWCPIVCGHDSWGDLMNWLEPRVSKFTAIDLSMEEMLKIGGVIWKSPPHVDMPKL